MTDNQTERKPLEEQVLEAIKSGRVKMTPKWHFALNAGLLLTGALVVLLTLLYLSSSIIFMMRQSGVWFLPNFGFKGWSAFFSHLPWLMLFLLIVFIIFLEILIRHYSFTYRRPLLYSFLAVIFLAAIGGFLAERTHFHNGLSRFTQEKEVPLFNRFYRDFSRPRFEDVHQGRISQIIPEGFLLKDINGDILTVIVPTGTNPFIKRQLTEDESIMVFGQLRGNIIRADGIREAEEMK
jgi:hypothetical protein